MMLMVFNLWWLLRYQLNKISISQKKCVCVHFHLISAWSKNLKRKRWYGMHDDIEHENFLYLIKYLKSKLNWSKCQYYLSKYLMEDMKNIHHFTFLKSIIYRAYIYSVIDSLDSYWSMKINIMNKTKIL